MWRRQRPAVVAVAALAIAACYPLVGYPGWAPMLPMFVALFSLSAYGATPRALYGALALCVITYLLPVVSSQIAVQSGLAVDAMDDDTATTRRALAAIRASTKEALAELRATLTLLRADTDAAAVARPTRPQPRLADLPDLVAQTRAAGLMVRFSGDVAGASGTAAVGLSPTLELTAFRVVQESLTNVVRHAKATSVVVEVRRDGDQLHITVADDGHGPQGDQTGYGVRGMVERVLALGGTLVTGPGPERGYEVRAVPPL
jgi:signal transduction histidine kinase